MRSQFADKFNHDEDAAGYDLDVRNEADPIRAGYAELLDWVIQTADTDADSVVLDLGTGTGNLAQRLPAFRQLICVDISKEMLQLAQEKLAAVTGVRYVEADLLEFFERTGSHFDAIISTYAIHHLTETEKPLLFEKIAQRLQPGGIAVFGDLMFENAAACERYLEYCRNTARAELADAIEDEFFWNVESACQHLRRLGLDPNTRRFSDLSWGIAATKDHGNDQRIN
jgi:putative AdoMet-dependent methyltransferase